MESTVRYKKNKPIAENNVAHLYRGIFLFHLVFPGTILFLPNNPFIAGIKKNGAVKLPNVKKKGTCHNLSGNVADFIV